MGIHMVQPELLKECIAPAKKIKGMIYLKVLTFIWNLFQM